MQSTTCDNDFTLLQLIFRYCDFNKSIGIGIVDTVFTTVVVLLSYLFRPSFTMPRISIPATLSFSCLIFSTRSTSSIIFLSLNFSWPIVLQFLPHGYPRRSVDREALFILSCRYVAKVADCGEKMCWAIDEWRTLLSRPAYVARSTKATRQCSRWMDGWMHQPLRRLAVPSRRSYESPAWPFEAELCPW